MKQPYLFALFFLLPLALSQGQDETLHPWTDTQGRTLTASFVSSDGKTVTIKYNGTVFPLPLNTLSPQSQDLARKLSAPAEPKSAPAPASPFDQILAAIPEDTLGPEALDLEHDWSSADGRALKAKFITLSSDQLTLAMNNGAKQFTIALNMFSAESQSLAKLLQALAEKHRPAAVKPVAASSPAPSSSVAVPASPVAPAVPAKPLPLPAVTEDDLEKDHAWTNAAGNPLEAKFLAADEKEITLKIKSRSSPYVLTWDKLSPESQALGKALQKLKKSLVPIIQSAGDKILERFGSGKWKGYNTMIESVAFEAGVHSNGTMAHIWMVGDDGVRKESSRIDVSFRGIYFKKRTDPTTKKVIKDANGNPTYVWTRRKLKSLSGPEVSNDRKKTTIEGEWENGTTFKYYFELSHAGCGFWADAKESKSEEEPTFLVIDAYTPRLMTIEEAAVASVQDIQNAAGDGAIYLDPIKGKKLKFPFSDPWTDIKAKLTKSSKGEDFYSVKLVELYGSPFGDHRVKIEHKAKDTDMRWDIGYGTKFPLQGMSLDIKSKDGSEAQKFRGPEAQKLKDRLEIGYGDRIQVKVIRGS